jgi:TRAP-type C4-dicarboxylate transport system permease small subunit
MEKLSKEQESAVKKEVEKQVEQKVERHIKKQIAKRLLEETTLLGSEFKKQISTALIAAFGLIIALSWQDVIKKIVETFPKSGILIYHPYLSSLYVAILITFIAIIGILIISKWAKKPEQPKPIS